MWRGRPTPRTLDVHQTRKAVVEQSPNGTHLGRPWRRGSAALEDLLVQDRRQRTEQSTNSGIQCYVRFCFKIRSGDVMVNSAIAANW